MLYLKIFLATLPLPMLLDALWLGVVMKGVYQREVGTLMGDVRWLPTLLVYLLLVAGAVFLVLPRSNNAWMALAYGAFYGLIVYGVYDFTNLAILKQWTVTISLLDLGWGVVLCGVVSVVAFALQSVFR